MRAIAFTLLFIAALSLPACVDGRSGQVFICGVTAPCK